MQSPLGFSNQGVDGLFFRNAGQYIIVFYLLGAIYLGIYLVYRLFKRLAEKKPRFEKPSKYAYMAMQFFEWGMFIGGFEAAFLSNKLFIGLGAARDKLSSRRHALAHSTPPRYISRRAQRVRFR